MKTDHVWGMLTSQEAVILYESIAAALLLFFVIFLSVKRRKRKQQREQKLEWEQKRMLDEALENKRGRAG